MGEVYRARDTRLNRTVAIKVLPHDKVADPDRERRFLQEARAASALNHPHIVTLHDIVHEAGIDFLVMEYVAASRWTGSSPAKGLPLARGARVCPAAGKCAGRRARGRHRAPRHQARQRHRDARRSGEGPRLRTGEARSARPGGSGDGNPDAGGAPDRAGHGHGHRRPTCRPSRPAAASVDHRTDIFSLGVVLYEMLAGQRPFRGTSQVETMHAIINDPPLPLSQPPELQDILDKALAKDPKERYQHAGDFGLDLRRFLQRPSEARRGSSGTGTGQALPWVAAAVFLLALPVAWWAGHRAVAAPGQTAAAVAPSITPFTSNLGYNGEASIAPDNQTIAYVSDRTGRFEIFLRQIGTTADIPLTHDQGDNIQPAFSPDGRQIAFVSSRGGAPIFYPGFDNPMTGGDIWVMPALGGTPRRIAKDGNFPSWSPDGTKIVFARNRIGLFEVAASGGDVRAIKLPTAREPITLRTRPMPDGSSSRTRRNAINVVAATGGDVQQIGTGRHPVWDDSSQSVIYSDSREGNNHSLWSVPFSTRDGKTSGPARPLTIGRGRDWQPAVSRDGRLVAYTAIQTTFNLEVVPFDAEAGRVLGPPRVVTTGNQVSYFMRFSPDGRSVAFESSRGAGRHIWRVDIGAEPVQLTSDPKFEETFPQWSPDGNTIAFTRHSAQSPNAKTLWLMDPDGANPRQILEGNNLTRWLPDGSGIVYQSLKTRNLPLRPRDRPLPADSHATRRGDHAHTQSGRTVDRLPGHGPGCRERRCARGWLAWRTAARGGLDTTSGFASVLLAFGALGLLSTGSQESISSAGPGQDWKPADPAKMTDFPESERFLEDPQFSRDGKQLLYSRGKISGDIWILKRGE